MDGERERARQESERENKIFGETSESRTRRIDSEDKSN